MTEGLRTLHAAVRRTEGGTPYLREAGVVLVARPQVDLGGLAGFLDGFEPSLGFGTYLEDPPVPQPGARLSKVAGQCCYLSFGPRRTRNADAGRYLRNILESGHGSVLEHASYSMLLYGVSRSLTHELVRHRAGVAVSQVSQRYVGGPTLRFVERPEFAADPELHGLFEGRVDRAAAEYAALAETLRQRRLADPAFAALRRTDQRKAVQQAARALLPNETEAPIVVTANVRAWRHVIAMRCDPHAEPEIRRAMRRVWQLLVEEEPLLFGDFTPEAQPDGSEALRTPFPKV